MKLSEAKYKIKQILKPRDIFDDMFVYPTSHIIRRLGYHKKGCFGQLNSHSWVLHILSCLENEGYVKKTIYHKRFYWNIKEKV